MTPKTKSSFFRRDDSKAAPATTPNTDNAPSRGGERPTRAPRSFNKETPGRGGERPTRAPRAFDRERPDRGGERPARAPRAFDRERPDHGGERPTRAPRAFDRERPDRGGERPARAPRAFDRERPDRGGERPTRAPRAFDRERPDRGGERPTRFAAPERPTERVERPERKTRSNESFSPRTEKVKKSFAAPKTAEIPTVLRLNRFIAQSGICSRREADELIKRGEIMVNDVVTVELGQKVDTTKDVIKYEGKPLTGEKLVYIIMNKPKGYVTTTEDPHAEQTVIDLLKGQVRERVYPVGRLDKNTTGVLLLTNDGDLTRELTHPSLEKRKIYHVFLDKPVAEEHLEQMAKGIELEDGMMSADQVSYVDGNRKEVGVEIHSGRNRVVRRMFEHFEYRVIKLDRVYFAGFTKEGLRRGFWRPLTAREVSSLKGGQYK